MAKHHEVPLKHRRALNQLLLKRPAPSALSAGEWLSTLRWALRMTQSQLAKRGGITQQHVALIESGKVDPRLSTLKALLEALFCDFVVIPVPRKRPGEIVAARTADLGLDQPSSRIWDTM